MEGSRFASPAGRFRQFKAILALALMIIGFVFVGCDNGSANTSKDILDETVWESSATENVLGTDYLITGTIQFSSPDIEWKYSYDPAPSEAVAAYFPTLITGTYTVSGNSVTISLPEPYPELNGTVSGDTLTFKGDEGEPDIVYTKIR